MKPFTLELGPGTILRGDVGLDSSRHSIDKHNGLVRYCLLGFDNIPYSNDTFDKVFADQVLEHIPGVVYYHAWNDNWALRGWRQYYPLVDLFNEVYRVLKPNGLFEFKVPRAGTGGFYGDPTHTTNFDLNTINYFSGDYFNTKELYGHTSNFELVKAEMIMDNQQLHFILKAVK